MHESLNEVNFRPDTTTNTRVIFPCASEKLMYNVVSTLAPSFLIGSSSYLQVMRTFITSRTSSKFDQIGPRTAELAALERLKKIPIDLYWENRCCHVFSAVLGQIHFILAVNDDIHESLDKAEIRPDLTIPISMAIDMVIMEKTVLPLFSTVFIQLFSYLQVLQLVSDWDATN